MPKVMADMAQSAAKNRQLAVLAGFLIFMGAGRRSGVGIRCAKVFGAFHISTIRADGVATGRRLIISALFARD